MPKRFRTYWNLVPTSVKWAFVLLAALILRLLLLWHYRWDNPDGDAAVAGLMAKHIAEGRALPVFFYGQSYFGALEPYLNALLFFVLGFSPNLINVLPLLFSMALIGVEYLFARALFDARIARFSALVMAIGPGTLLLVNLNAGGGFALAMLLQLLALWFFGLLYFRQVSDGRAFPAFCFVSGLACWVWQIYIPVFFVLVALLVLRKLRVSGREMIFGVGLFLLASSPLWFYNWQNGGATFMQGMEKVTATSAETDLSSTLQAMLGNRIEHWDVYLRNWLKAPGGGNPLLSAIMALGLAANWRQFQIRANRGFLELSPVAFCLVIGGLYFLLGNTAVHYLFILFPLLIPAALQGWRSWNRVPIGLVVTAILLINLYSVWTLMGTSVERPNWAGLISQLQARELAFGYSDYWNAYPITFLSGEKIIVSPRLLTYGGRRTDRYPSYTSAVERAGTIFIFAPDNSPESGQVEQMADMRTRNSPLQSLSTPEGIVYFPLGPEDALRRWLASLKPN